MKKYESVSLEARELNECNDCAVRMVAIVGDLPYKTVHDAFAKIGRKPRSGTTLGKINRLIGKEMRDWVSTRRVFGRRLTPSVFARENPKGRFMCITRNHALAIVDGVVEDWSEGRRHQITHFIKYT